MPQRFWCDRIVLPNLLAFTAVAVLLVAIPGPAVVLTLKSALLRGRQAAFGVAFGVLVADLVWAMATAAGLTALLVSSQIAFDIVRVVGALYLLYLGVRLALSRNLAVLGSATQARTETDRRGGLLRSFREGLLCDLSNPKTMMVFASVIPQFLSNTSHPGEAFVLGLAFAVVGLCSLLVYAMVFGTARRAVKNTRVTRALLRGSGGVLGLFGVGLLAETSAT
ncbi:LysE family translocator [Nocardia sp. CC201C]|uniref:LysE family translocator n=1 Tax=Nocardia sp. CC201C TaxID=3044575 RepID=UPI0024A98B65|nr:LysE family translocator [Nocardia sp. CC201C]